MDLVDDLDMSPESIEQPLGKLEAKVEPMSPQMEKHVALCRDRGVLRAPQLGELVQAGRPQLTEEPVPERGTQSDDTGQLALGKAESDRASEPADVRDEASDHFLRAAIDRHDEKDRRFGKGRQNCLSFWSLHGSSVFCAIGVGNRDTAVNAPARPPR